MDTVIESLRNLKDSYSQVGNCLSVYLGGAMDNVDPSFAVGWRKDAKTALQRHGFIVYDPTDGKDHYKQGKRKIYNKTTSQTEIVTPDLKCIGKSHILLVEISRKDIPYHGTSMELVYGKWWEKHIYVWGDCKSPWVIHHSTKMFPYMEDALNYILTNHK